MPLHQTETKSSISHLTIKTKNKIPIFPLTLHLYNQSKHARSSQRFATATRFPQHLLRLLLRTLQRAPFFHDRSATLGALMGVSFPAISFRAPSQHRDMHVIVSATSVAGAGTRSRMRNKKKSVSPTVPTAAARRRWWRLCGDDDAKPASLREFLEVERRFRDTAFYDAAAEELEGVNVSREERQLQRQELRNGRLLFADRRVLPLADNADETSSTAEVLCRFPVSITGFCR